MKKILTTLFLLNFLGLQLFSQISFTSAVVPQYVQGNSGTNNNRTPFYYWVELSGLTPNATYRYYATFDTLLASATSNGAGNPLLIDMGTQNFRRTTSAGLTNLANCDTMKASATGTWKGWMGIEATGNNRFAVGNTVYPKMIFNNGSGGTTVAERVLINTMPVKVINYGTTPSGVNQGSFFYDSTTTAPKNFAVLFDNTSATGRPVSIAVTESDGLTLNAVTSIVLPYRNLVDTMTRRWGTIVPNDLPNGIRRIDYYDFSTGVSLTNLTDADGQWCWTNTVNPFNGTTASYIRSLEGIPAPNITTASANYCATDSITLDATGTGTLSWYTQSVGGTSFGSGSPVTHIAQPGFWVEAEQNGCISPRDSVFFTIDIPSVYYRDADFDAYGDPNDSIVTCNIVIGYTGNNLDCDDNDPAINPDATEVCDGVDNDCDLLVDEGCAFAPEISFAAPIWSSGVGPYIPNPPDSVYTCSYTNYVNDTIFIYVRNTGNDTLHLSSVSIFSQTSDHGNYTLLPAAPFVLAGDSTLLKMTYSFIPPNNQGDDSVTVRIMNNDPDESIKDIRLYTYFWLEAIAENTLSGIDVFPSLFTGTVYIRNTNETEIPVKMEIYDISGRVLMNKQISLSNGVYAINDLETLGQGIYFITLRSNTKVYSQKLVKQ